MHRTGHKDSTQYPITLDYRRPSPVRGQLEPYDEKATKGWRYLQCTDTPNQLKVLLPPNTASMYEQLLKVEITELAKKPPSWERILQIRHLKDRMIRKCQRLTKPSSPLRTRHGHSHGHAESFAFHTVHAPADFRMKELERWLRDEAIREPPNPSHSVESVSRRNSYCCSRCARESSKGHSKVSSARSSSKRSSWESQMPSPPPKKYVSKDVETPSIPPMVTPALPKVDVSPLPILTEEPQESGYSPIHHEVQPQPQAPEPFPPSPPPKSWLTVEPPSMEYMGGLGSPPPLPHLLRFRDSDTAAIGFPRIIVSNASDGASVDGDDTILPSLPSPPAEETAVPRDAVPRRRSCIKRNSLGDIKRVSWAEDRDWADQISKYTEVVREVEVSGKNWEETHATYMRQMAGLEALHENVAQSLERLRLETTHLEKVEVALRDQRAMLRATCDEFEQRQSQYRVKVQAVLEETDQTLSLCRAKREAHHQA